jgi:hypothetical protein
MLEMKRVLMMDFASTQAQTKEVAPLASQEEGQAEAAVAEPLSASPPLTTHWWSVHVGARPTQLLARLGPAPVGQGQMRHHPR